MVLTPIHQKLLLNSIEISEVTKEALLNSKLKIANKPRIQLVIKLNRTLPKIKEIIDKYWHLLQMKNNKLKNSFHKRPTLGYKRNRNLKKIIGINKILNNKVIRKKKAEKKQHFCSPFYMRATSRKNKHLQKP